jgi:hypothetical protein
VLRLFATVISALAVGAGPGVLLAQESTQGLTQNGNSTGNPYFGATYLNDIGHISAWGPYGDGVHDDSGSFQYALNACGVNFGTLEVTMPQFPTAPPTGMAQNVGYIIAVPLTWGSAATCRVIIRKGAIISGALPPMDPAHTIYDENDLVVDPFPPPTGAVATTDSIGDTGTLTPAGVSGGMVPFGGTPGSFNILGADATNGGYNAGGGNLTLGAGRGTGTANGGGIYFQTSPAAGSAGNGYNTRASAWLMNSAGNLITQGRSRFLGNTTNPVDSLYLCPNAVSCTYGTGYYNITGTGGIGSNTYAQLLPNNAGTFQVASVVNPGDLGYYNGTTFSVLTGNTASGTHALTESSSGVPSWTALAAVATSGSASNLTTGTPGAASSTPRSRSTAALPSMTSGTPRTARVGTGAGPATASAATPQSQTPRIWARA